MKRSIFRASFLSSHWSGWKPFTSQANWVVCFEQSKSAIRPAPERPASRPSHVGSAPKPSGDTTPNPVTTTLLICFLFENRRRRSGGGPLSGELLLRVLRDVVDGALDV